MAYNLLIFSNRGSVFTLDEQGYATPVAHHRTKLMNRYPRRVCQRSVTSFFRARTPGIRAAFVLVLLLCAAAGTPPAIANDCPENEVRNFTVGAGNPFRFWYTLDSIVIPVTMTWHCERWEIGAFYFGRQYQRVDGERHLDVRGDAAVSLTRRLVLHRWKSSNVFCGLGGSYRTKAGFSEGNPFNGSHLNIAEQLGVRWMRPDHQQGIELSLRHFSNLGIVKPNVGQNFFVAAVVF